MDPNGMESVHKCQFLQIGHTFIILYLLPEFNQQEKVLIDAVQLNEFVIRIDLWKMKKVKKYIIYQDQDGDQNDARKVIFPGDFQLYLKL